MSKYGKLKYIKSIYYKKIVCIYKEIKFNENYFFEKSDIELFDVDALHWIESTRFL